MVWLLTYVAGACLVFSIYIQFRHQPSSSGNVPLLGSLRDLRDQVSRPKGKQVAVGYNACLDIVLDAVQLMQALDISPVSPAAATECTEITTKEELGSCFQYFFSKASAGERTVKNEALFEEVNAVIKTLEYRAAIGGNAALMGVVFIEDYSFDVMLGGQVGEELRKLLPQEMKSIGMKPKVHAIANEPVKIRNDESHIIMEYKKNSKWEGADSPSRANRFIISSDASNAAISTFEPLNSHIKGAKSPPDLLVAAGLHMMDAQSAGFRKERIVDITRGLESIPSKTKVHFELASMGDQELLKSLASSVLPRVDSLGLNEQELTDLYAALGGKFSGAMSRKELGKSVPNPQLVSRALEFIFDQPKPATRTLTRIHFHCFGYHIIAQRDTSVFANIKEGAISGSVKATERACDKKSFVESDLELHLTEFTTGIGEKFTVNADNPVAEWTAQSGNKYVLAPVLACARPVQTVGLGDSISASALAYQI